ncbi:uncharacterized protein DUF748 [Trinickia symbiotica]|uniref:DUF748 domain-containing protein n=1 Tax=Trinickia symbiotica TaxID=863227 RepID=A0A2N7X6G2_9BURK|nr:DUF748 domain-containing protein [Trinickia symbiotica]PMS37343.1 DUF748 domain-containing protein [Trinickia symbiotica]PPK42853.1 uncharacterized protein DUF748 [Trinickia symbiotica]
MSSETKAGVAKTFVKVRKATHSRRLRRIAVVIVVLIVLYGLIGFFAAPPLIRHIAEQQMSEALGRPAHIERVSLNPYTLRLEADRIRVGEQGGAGDFASIERLVVQASWFSLLRFAPIVDEVKVDSPHANIVRYDAQRFNFSDIADKFANEPSKPSKGPALFSVSNIDVENGRIDFDDRLAGRKHVIDRLSLGVPFIATLPSKTNIFVDPRFVARVDGSPIHIAGKTKPFAASRESEIALKFDDLDVPQMLSFSPTKLPVTVASGKLAGDLTLRFVMTGSAPALTVTGTTDLADAQVVDERKAPLFAARAVHVAAASLEPLRKVFRFDEIRLDQPSLHLARERSGDLSISRTLAGSPSTAASSAVPASAAGGAASTATAPKASAASAASAVGAAAQAVQPLDLSIKHFALNDGDVGLEDHAPAQPVSLGLTHLDVSLDGFSTVGETPAHYDVHTVLAQGGTLAATGALSLAAKSADLKLTTDGLPLTLVQPYLAGSTSARIDGGTLGTALTVKADWSKTPTNVQVAQSDVTVKSLKVTGPAVATGANAPTPALALDEGHVAIKQVDLAARKADISAIDLAGLSVNGARAKDGRIDLMALAGSPQEGQTSTTNTQAHEQKPHGRERGAARTSEGGQGGKEQTAANAPPAAGAQSGWHYTIGAVRLKDGSAQIVDEVPAHPATVRLSSIQFEAHDVSDDMHRALPIKLAATLGGKGTLDVSGDVTPSPLAASVTLHANRLDVSSAEPYFGDDLNAKLASAFLNAGGDVKLGMANDALTATFRGGVALVDVKLLDRTTSAPLAGWRALSLARMNARYDAHGTDVDIGRITFSQFFGSVLLDEQGKLNLQDVLGNEHKPSPATGTTASHRGSTTTVAEAPKAAPSQTQPPFKAHVGEIVLQQGHVNYTDHFVKPNYTANLVDITGTIGAFGTEKRAPAPVDVSANLAGNGPITIRGTADPLAPKPSLDLGASAHEIELKSLTPYSLKYAGYPITKGQLNVDLHYKLENDVLTANNHIFISQLTFGDHVENSTETHLPVKLAIALLKNRRGEIDVNIPVSGSLANPQFSIGSVIWGAIRNLISKAVTAPFTLLANAFGGGGADSAHAAEQLHYVAFTPGSADLSDAARGKLDTIAKLLTDKPEVKLELTGRADPAIDTPGLRLAYVDDLVKKEKAQDLAAKGQKVDLSTVKVDQSEYSDYLKKAYKDADFKKPRNFIGMTKSMPDDDMKRMLANHATVDEASLRALAERRADAVRQYLIAKVDAKRITVGAPKLDANEVKDSGPTTRVDFGLQ